MDHHTKTRALVVEDDFLVGEMVRGMVEDLGCVVVGEARDGREAVEATQRLRPDVILMDVEMPGMDGIEATRRIQECCPTPVVILTAYETPEMLEQASAAGVGAYLVKPPKPKEIERAITIGMARFDDLMALRRLNVELQARNKALEEVLAAIEVLSGLLPICPSCKRIRNDKGYWRRVERYVTQHDEVACYGNLCPACAARKRSKG